MYAAGAMAVPDAVEARQVRRRFRRRDHVVHRYRQPDVREREVDRDGAEVAQFGERVADGLRYCGVDTGAEILGGKADPDAGKGSRAALHRQRSRIVLDGAIERGRITRVVARHRVQQQREVVCGARERAGLIEAGSEGDQPEAGTDAVGRLQAADARHGRRLANGAAGVGAGAARHQARRDCRRRAARTAPGHIGRVPGILHRAEMRRFARRAHRELVHVGLADEDGAGASQAVDDVRVERRRVVREHPRATGSAHARRGENVLVRNRNAEERPAVAVGENRIGRLRVGERPLGIDGDEGVERRIERRDAIERRPGELDAREALCPKGGGKLRDGGIEHTVRPSARRSDASGAVHSSTFGTR